MSTFARRVRDLLHMALSARANRYWMRASASTYD
jgi:hypothetical protein